MKTQRTVTCPRCQKAPLDTVTSAPYIRGFVLAYNYGSKRFVGCNGCVKKQLAGEVGLSLVAGWFSITSLLVNPLCILWNGLRLPFVKADPDKVEALLKELGVLGVDTETVDMPRIAASLAVTMVAADGKVDPVEIETAIAIGTQLIEGFTPALFHDVLRHAKRLPGTAQLAGLLCDILEEPGKVALLKYLLAIASSDGRIDDAEIDELEAAAQALGLSLEDF